MVSGFLSTVLWVLFFKEQAYGLYEMIPGFLVGLSVTVGVSWITEPPPGAAEEMNKIRQAIRAKNPGG